MKTVVSLVLTVASMLKSSIADNKELNKSSDEAITSTVKGLYPQLESWIKVTLYGISFGSSKDKFCEHESKEELKVSNKILYFSVTVITLFSVFLSVSSIPI